MEPGRPLVTRGSETASVGEGDHTKGRGQGDFPKMAAWSLSVLTEQALPPQIKGREVAGLSAALSHVKLRRRPYMLLQIKLAGITLTKAQ